MCQKIIPIYRHELAKFLHTATLIFLITYVHSIIRITKDVLIMANLGTEAISAIKIWVVLPISLIFMFFYIKLSDKFTRSQLFHAVNWTFISYFVLFAFAIYPNRDALTINISKEFMDRLPALKYLFIIIKNWHHCLFYAFSDCWATIMLSISFWQIANHITSFEESKRFYFLFGFAAQIGLLLASLLSKLFTSTNNKDWQLVLSKTTITVVIAGIAISMCSIALKNLIGSHVFNLRASQFKNKNKISMKESLKYIASSKPILLITSLILCYNVSVNLVEGVWKKTVEVSFCKDSNLIHHFMSNVNFCTSVLSLICAASGIYLSRVCKWRTVALITPIAALFTGCVFFIFMIFSNVSYGIATPSAFALSMAMYFGAINTVFARATKHTLFDTTKEIVYIPLDDDLKTKGKAAAEAIGMGFGKGIGALIEQVLLVISPAISLLTLSPIFSIIFLIVSMWWLYSTISLSKWLSKAGI